MYNPYYFTGRRYDEETGLYYYRARYYSPSIGRFLQTDPIGYRGGINLYAYVGNNSTSYVDPMGLCKNGTYGFSPGIDSFGDPYGLFKWLAWFAGISFDSPYNIEDLSYLAKIAAFANEMGVGTAIFSPGIAYAAEDDPTPWEPLSRDLARSSVGGGIINEVLIAGGIGLIAAGLATANPALIAVGIGVAIVGGLLKVHEIASLPDRGKRIAMDVYEKTGMGERDEELDKILDEADRQDRINRRRR